MKLNLKTQRRVLKTIAQLALDSPNLRIEHIQNFNTLFPYLTPGELAKCLSLLEWDSYIDVDYLSELDCGKPLSITVFPKGFNFAQNKISDTVRFLIPVALSVLAIIISIIALLK